MKKRIISLFVVISLLTGVLLPTAASAADSFDAVDVQELENATKVITNAISELDDTFAGGEAAAATDIFEGFLSVVQTGGTILTAVNGSVNFLKLIGVVKDANSEALSNITKQMQSISETIDQMNRKLDNITSEMSKLRASSEFNARTEQALLLQSNWNDFQYRYEETGMDDLMTEYSAVLLDGLRRWCVNQSEDSRTEDGMDNSKIIVLYRQEDGEFIPTYSAQNGIPADFPDDGRYLILSEDFLPESVSWNINTYREVIQTTIAEQINAAVQAGEFDRFSCGNFPEFTEEGAEELTQELIDQVAEDAVNTLSYRIACTEVNRSAAFSLRVRDAFRNYCSHLLAAGEGVDAALKTYYLTHAFEFEVSDDITAFCNQMAVKTATYGAFAMNILGLSDFSADADKTEAMSAYCRSLNGIGQAKENSLTGNDGYCYLTNTELYFTELRFTASATVDTKEDQAITAYRSSKGNAIQYDISGKWGSSHEYTKDALIGDDNMLLLAYTMRSNRNDMSYDYLQTHLCDWWLSDYGAIVTSFGQEEAMPLTSSAPLRVTRILGRYFRDGSNISLEKLPEDADSDYVCYRKMVSGSIYRPSTLSVDNTVLSGLAIYGENHGYWLNDEVAILGSSPNQGSFTASFDRIRQDYQYYFTYKYHQSVGYNCLVCRNVSPKLTGSDEYNPLNGYTELNEKLRRGEHGDEELAGFSGSRSKSPLADQLSHDAYYYNAVAWAEQNRVIFDVVNAPSDLFAPCTRAQMITFLWRSAGSPNADGDLAFADLEQSAYYAPAVRWAVSEGIAKGASDTEFLPDAACTRAQAVVFLARFAGVQDADAASVFSDVRSTDYCASAVKWAKDNDITKGTSATTFSPNMECSCVQALTMLYRLMNQ